MAIHPAVLLSGFAGLPFTKSSRRRLGEIRNPASY